MKKPTAKSRKGKYLDWSDSCKYLESICGKELRNYAGRKYTGMPNDPPYQDFWHWIVHHNDGMANGSEFSIPMSQYTNEEPWVMEILALIKSEFGDEPIFWAEW